MHIAICDDNIADRKQLERLLKRESDKRAAVSGILYTDSFGNAEALLANPMQYDAFYIDVCQTEGVSGSDIVSALTAKGVNAPIVMCCSHINYREYTLPSNVIFPPALTMPSRFWRRPNPSLSFVRTKIPSMCGSLISSMQ